MKRILTSLSLITCCAAWGCGGSSSDSQADAIKAALAQYRTTYLSDINLEVPGVSSAISEPDGRTHLVSDGKASLSDASELHRDSIFHVGSITKTFTAAWILQLDQEGLLSIDDPLSQFVAYPNGDAITVRQLLSHISGLPAFTAIPSFLDYLAEHPYPSPQEIIHFTIQNGTPDFAPGASYNYSNTNYYLLGMIGEQVTGKTWQEEMRSRFIEPLGLKHTFAYGYEDTPESVTGYTLCADTACTSYAINEYGTDSLWKLGWAAGSLISTPEDLNIWMHALISGDVLDATHREEMKICTPQSKQVLGSSTFFTGMGLGVFCVNSQTAAGGWGHDGAIAGFVAIAADFPASGYSGALAINLSEASSSEALEDALAAAE